MAARLHVIFSGWVQGVGFRYTTEHVARGFDVTGYVMNLSDGSVECIAEGERAELEAFLATVSERLGSHIRGRDVTWGPARGNFDRFGIRLG